MGLKRTQQEDSFEIALERTATFVHGALAALHMLGFVHNVRKGNRLDATVHGLVFAYDIGATLRHAHDARALTAAR